MSRLGYDVDRQKTVGGICAILEIRSQFLPRGLQHYATTPSNVFVPHHEIDFTFLLG